MTNINEKVKETELDKLYNSVDFPALPKQNDMVEGEVVYVGRNEILVDIDGLSTGLIRGHEAYDESGEYNNLKVGDKISATVVDAENEKGLIELSIRQAGHKKAWDRLRNLKSESETVEVVVIDANKGGLMVRLDQTMGFLPVSQLAPQNYPRVIGGNKAKILEKLKSLIGKKIKVKVLDVNDEEASLIVSERLVEADKRKEQLVSYDKGSVVEGVVTGVVDFGAFMEFGEGLEGLIHISELGWQRIDDPRDVVKEGQKVKAQIIDISTNKVSLSLKRLEKDPWDKIKEQYKIGDKVEGKVIKLHKLGAFVEIAENIQGLARAEEVDKNEKQVKDVFKEGDMVKCEITNFEPNNHKLGLKLV